jgi:membrane protein
LLFFASSSATVLANTKLDEILGKYEVLVSLRPIITFLIQLLPYILMFIVTTVTFLVMPNTRVKYRCAGTAGLITAVALQLVQIVYIQSQMGLTKLNTLYGGFAAIPLLMIWMQMSWVLVLVGAQLSFYLQNITKHEFEFDVQNVSLKQRRRLSLLIMHLLVKDFIVGRKPRSPQEISLSLNIPVRSVRESLLNLNNASLVTEIYNESKDINLYQPAIDVNKLSLAYVIEKLDTSGSLHKNVINHQDYRKIDAALSGFETMIASSEKNVLLRDI